MTRLPGSRTGWTLAALAALGLPFLLVWLRTPASPDDITVDPPEIHVGGPDAESDFEFVQLTLRNQSPRDRVLQSIQSSCTCVSIDPVRDLVLPAGTGRTLGFRVRLPDSGTTVSEIRWHLDRDPEPRRCRIFASGRRALPLIRSVDPASLTFLGLTTTDVPTKTLTLHTREPKPSSPWISTLNCNLEELQIGPVTVEEKSHPNDQFLDRRYQWGLSWKVLPSSTEFRGRLTARTADHRDIPVGSVSGSRLDPVRLSPSHVLLSAHRRTETVYFSPPSPGWSVEERSIPDWLRVETAAGPRGPCLRLALREFPLDDESRSAMLSLQSTAGQQLTLPVRLDP